MGHVLRAQWIPTIAGLGTPRRDAKGGSYEAYVPDRLRDQQFTLEGVTAADVSDAELAIAAFDSRAAALTGTEALARLLLRAESVASSRIEGLSISPQRLLLVAADQAEGVIVHDQTAIEVLANVNAMALAVSSSGPITVGKLLEVHCELLKPTRAAEHAGNIREQQNWLGGSNYNPINAAFVPPPASEVSSLLQDLCDFCNRTSLSPVVQAAIAHAQFETIHPFIDGNGRTGRALIYMVLRRRGLAVRAIPPISLVLATHAKTYEKMLDGTRYIGKPGCDKAIDGINAWIAFFATACTRAVADAGIFESKVAALTSDWRSRLGNVRPKNSALSLLSILPQMPILTVRGVEEALGCTFATANDAVALLVNAHILSPTKQIKRNRNFEARELIEAFTALERQLASPDGDTRTSKPARIVPMRPTRAMRK